MAQSDTPPSKRLPMQAALKHRWSIAHNYLAGICAEDWQRLLRENRYAVDPVYWHRAAAITALSVINSFYRREEERRFGKAVRDTAVTQAPLFVLGHWRSGTTHLHNLLALDTDQFAYPNTYQVVNPHTFLTTEEVNTRRFAWLLPNKRPMDNMALSFQSPQEDEFALLLTCFYSLYLGISFPRREEHYRRYLTFRDVPPREVAQWQAAFLGFARKLTFKYGDKALVFKSPPHTSRVRLLLELFPGARFVHIHRDPYVVFRSFQHHADTTLWYTYLQRPDLEGNDRRILERYNVMYDAFFEDRPLIPAAQYHELAFEDLERDPIDQMRMLYDKLSLPGFEKVRPKLQNYLAALGDYQKNRYSELPTPLREAVATSWRRTFVEWQYSI
jgi:hypothetical protein